MNEEDEVLVATTSLRINRVEVFADFEQLFLSLTNLLAGMDGSITLLGYRQVRIL